MKSQIRVDFDFDTNQPVIRLKLDRESEELADKTLRHFIEMASGSDAIISLSFKDDPSVCELTIV